MAIKILAKDESKLLLELTGGDYSKLDLAIKKWEFKDYQSFLRFAISIILVNEGKSLSIKIDGIQTFIKPSDDLLLLNI